MPKKPDLSALPKAEEAPAVATVNGAPWANPKCPSCKGLGFNLKNGTACKICDATAKASKGARPQSIQYEITHTEETGFLAIARDEHAAALEEAGFPLQWAEKIEDDPTSQPCKLDALKPAKASAPAAQAEEAAEQAEAEANGEADDRPKSTEGKGRPRNGYILLIGASFIRGPARRKTLTIQELLRDLGAELAKDLGAKDYYELEPFKRRERLKQAIDKIVERLGNTIILVPGVKDPDIDSLVSALISHEKADMVIEGTR